jgi:hypothetical protein
VCRWFNSAPGHHRLPRSSVFRCVAALAFIRGLCGRGLCGLDENNLRYEYRTTWRPRGPYPAHPFEILRGYSSGGAALGISSQLRPSRRRPTARLLTQTTVGAGLSPGAGAHSPHCLKKNGTPATMHWSRSQSGCVGRARTLISPPATAQSSGCHAGPSVTTALPRPSIA